MDLENYKDMSSYGSSPGFQFEFHCKNCDQTWRSQFKPYRRGQVAGFFGNLMSNFHIGAKAGAATRLASEAGLASAKAAALAEARQTAATLHNDCANCPNAERNDPRSASAGTAQSASNAAPGLSCPNCRAPHGGGRFCAECGFDMASTHKSCPECGAMALRQARFCNECGHGF